MRGNRIIYCSDKAALKEKLKEEGFYNEENEAFYVNYTFTPIVTKDNKSLSVVKNMDLDFNKFPMLEDLGTYETILLEENADKLAKFKSVNDYETPITIVDEGGNEEVVYRPFKIGEIG